MAQRDLNKAREAYKKGDAEASKEAHSTIMAEDHKVEQGKYIKSTIYGGLDGIITTFAVVAGVTGASLQVAIVLILGLANLLADGLSMAIGDYLSTKAENEYQADERKREAWEVKHYPEGEKKEMIEIYTGKGISQADAEQVVSILSSYEEPWLDIMMAEELGIIESDESPINNAIVTFVSFIIFGFIPLVAYIFSMFFSIEDSQVFLIAVILTGLTLFLLGALKVKVTGKNWVKSGLEMLFVGGLAAIAAYGIGFLLAGLAS